MEEKKIYVKDFAKLVNKHPKTVQRWTNAGKLPDRRDFSNYRYFTQEDVDKVLKNEKH